MSKTWAVLFDLDGVLIDACEWHYQALNKALFEICNVQISENEHLSTFNGLPTKTKLEILEQQNRISTKQKAQIWEKKQEYTIDAIKNNSIVDNSKLELINALKAHGIKVGCVTNSISKTAILMLETINLLDKLNVIITNEDVQNSKPSPEGYLKAMNLLGSNPENTIIVEDSDKGFAAAQASGCSNLIRVPNATHVTVNLFENILTKVNVIIPMAGKGQRFVDAGFLDPKPFIKFDNDQTLIEVVTDNVLPKNFPSEIHYLALRKHIEDKKYGLTFDSNEIIFVEKVTEGAACTVLLAKSIIDNKDSLLLANSDQYIDFDVEDFIRDALDRDLDASIVTFTALDKKWSFVKMDKQNKYVVEVAEKNPISDIATVGIYWWRKGSDFVRYANEMIDKNIRVNNEFYVCPVFNEAINAGKKIGIYHVAGMYGFGTPDDWNRNKFLFEK